MTKRTGFCTTLRTVSSSRVRASTTSLARISGNASANFKRSIATHPALLKPTGWKTFEHNHDWTGGFTLCVVGFCYYHREERYYAIRRIADLRVLDELSRQLRSEAPLAYARHPPPRIAASIVGMSGLSRSSISTRAK